MPPDGSRPRALVVADTEQWADAVHSAEGPQLVVAGPGAGKTQFLIDRAVHLLQERQVDPGRIVVLTFSRRAAGDLGARISAGLDTGASGLDVSTFHSFAHRLLETHGNSDVGTLLTTPEQIRIVSKLLADEPEIGWPLPLRSILRSHTFAEEVADFLLRCQERLIDPSMLETMAAERDEWRALPEFFRRYDDHLRHVGRLDYGTLMIDALRCLRGPEVGAVVGDRYRYVLVDEYQDTSPVQAELLAALTAVHGNLTVAGDPYQSIYSFRGADLTNIASFPGRHAAPGHPDVRRIQLARSFRVPRAVLDAAVRITRGSRLPGAAGPVRPADHAGRVEAYIFDQQSAEAEWIAGEVERLLVEERLSPSQIAVLVRSKRRLLPELSRALDRRGVEHDRPDARLVDHPAVRAILDLTIAAAFTTLGADRLVGVARDLDRTMRRVLLGPLFGLPIMAEREIIRDRRGSAASWPEILRNRVPGGSEVADLLDHPEWAVTGAAADGFWTVWTSIGAFRSIVADPDRSDERRALAAFSQALNRQADRDPSLTLLGYAERAEADDFEATPLLSRRASGDTVTLTTLHQAKGLEFDVVFVSDASEGVFPDVSRPRSFLRPHLLSGSSERAAFALQEEIRLAYTAMTRARTRVIWTSTAAGVDEGEQRPSRFLLAAAGVASSTELSPGPERAGRPVSPMEIEISLRRTLVDPSNPAPRRLAAAEVLARPPIPVWSPERFAGVAHSGPDSGIVTGPVILSPSQAEAYESCPRRYALEKRLRLLEVESPYARFGAIVHAVLEEVERRASRHARRSTLAEAIDSLDAELTLVSFGTASVAAAWRSRGIRLLTRLYEGWPEDSDRAVALEHPLTAEIDGVSWRGRADRVELTSRNTLRIVDYKSGSTPPTRAEAGSSLQLGFYVLAARSDPELAALDRPLEAELWYPLARAKTWRLRFDVTQLDAVEQRLRAASSGILSEVWDARVSGACGRCPVRIVCDRWPQGREAFVE